MEEDKIFVFNSENEINNDLDRSFKLRRVVEQKAFYLENGANNYYDLNQQSQPHIKKSFDLDDNYNFFKKIFLKKNKKLALLSLGCGNAIGEKELLVRAKKDGFDVDYFGIDSSLKMLKLAKENLDEVVLKKEFINADFSSANFKSEIKKKLLNYDVKLFFFFGNTFGNVPQSYMADVLRNLLSKNDLLWINVQIRDKNLELKGGEIFQRYLSYLKNEKWIKFCTTPLIEKKFPLENGEFTLRMEKEKGSNCLKFLFGYFIKKDTELIIDDELVLLSKGDLVDLIMIRIYDLESLIHFFKIRNFNYLDNLVQGTSTHVVFEKK